MSTAEQVRHAALALPDADRAELIQTLIDSLEQPLSAEEERAFDEELDRRAEELFSGRVKGLTVEEVFARVDASLAEYRDHRNP